MPTLPRIVDAKVTHVNGGLTITWGMSDNTWTTPSHYTVPDDVCCDPAKIKQWCQNYKTDYNLGKDREEAAMDMQPEEVPAPVLQIIDAPLNLE